VGGAGDVNGDGFDDVLVGAHRYDGGQSNEGAAFLYLGSSNGLSLSPDWTAEGEETGAFLGVSVAGAGDVNADGFDDVIVGSYGGAFVYIGQGGDCNANGVEDASDIANGTSSDADGNGIPDECLGAGVMFCSGSGCPCGNDSAAGGCANSSGSGALLTGTGSTSFAADDLVLTTIGCPPSNTGLYLLGGVTFAPAFIGDGLLCTGGIWRYPPGQVTEGGVLVLTNPVASSPIFGINPGDTRHFQSWTRDVLCGPAPEPCPSPCGMNSNLSNGYTVLFTP
jgi:hypothetical protein